MSTTTASELESTVSMPFLPKKADWWWIAVIGLAFVLFFRHLIERSFLIITDDATSWLEGFKHLAGGRFNTDWSHGLLLPIISVYCIMQNRQHLAQARKRLCWLGLLMLFQGMLSFALWINPGRNDMLQGYSAVFALFGLVLFLLGPQAMRVLWFPILFMALAVKISDRYWEQIAWKLQWVASQSAAKLLMISGLDATIDGSTITLYRGAHFVSKLNVAEACSGLHMLMAFIALGTAVAFLSDRPAWQRWVIVLSTVPIAVGVNVGRVWAIGLLMLINPEMGQGNFHTFVGMLMLIPAFGLFLLLGWILDHLLIQEEMPAADRTGKKMAVSTSRQPSGTQGARTWFSTRRVALWAGVFALINIPLVWVRFHNWAFAAAWVGGQLLFSWAWPGAWVRSYGARLRRATRVWWPRTRLSRLIRPAPPTGGWLGDSQVAPTCFPTKQVTLLAGAIGIINVLLLWGFFLAQRLAENLFGWAGSFRNEAFAATWLGGILLSWALAWRIDQLMARRPAGADVASGGQVIGTLPTKSSPTGSPQTPAFPAIARAVGWGALLTFLVGAAYALMLGTIRPDFLKMDATRVTARYGLAVLLAVDLGLLAAVGCWMLRGLYGPARRGLDALLAGRGIALGVLLAAVVVLMGMLEVNGVVMIKERLPLRQSLSTVPHEAGAWQMQYEEPPLSEEIEKALGTKDYISRAYRDTSLPPGAAGAIVRMHVAFYTGKADTVPHVPWRCWLAAGVEPLDIGDMAIPLSGPAFRQEGGTWYAGAPGAGPKVRISENPLTATIFSYAGQPEGGNVVYFFVANGKFLKNPEMVRQKGFDPTDRYSYYAKVEIRVDQVPDQKEAAARVSAFLSAMLPNILNCLPDWDRATGGPGSVK